MSILKNGINSIALGIEDFNSPDPRRLLSCTRNLFAGILLLFKHKLVQLSPADSDEVLIKQLVFPVYDEASGLKWKGTGKKTVDVQKIEERFQSLKITVDWKRVKKINAYRNDIEHYYSHLSQDAVRTIISDSFIIIRDFVRNHLDQDPLTLLGVDTWSGLTKVAEVYEKEKSECIENVMSVDWKFSSLKSALAEFRCPKCGSGLIDVDGQTPDRSMVEFCCRSCGETWSFEGLAELAIRDYFSSVNYMAVKDGGDPATITCPICSRETYVLEEDICVVCEGSVERICQRCGIPIPPEELDGEGYCSWCNHMMSKDD